MPSNHEFEKSTDRRQFMARCSAVAAPGLLLGNLAVAADTTGPSLPTIKLGSHRVSRLIVGSNPISGYSYLGDETDREMRAYFTPDRTLAMLQQCEQVGINTHQFSPASKATDVYRKLRVVGSKLQLIGLYSNRDDIKPAIEAMRPIALVHHGGVTDRLVREDKTVQIRDFLKAVRDQGLLAGMSAHNPECIKLAAEEDWEADFFMTCFYNLSRERSSGGVGNQSAVLPPVNKQIFYRDDPLAMCEVIRQVKQPCLAFKILGAGRRCASQQAVREAFAFAFANIKPTDGVIVGMYPKRFDQVGANVAYTREHARTG